MSLRKGFYEIGKYQHGSLSDAKFKMASYLSNFCQEHGKANYCLIGWFGCAKLNLMLCVIAIGGVSLGT